MYGEHEILPSTELSWTNPCSPYGVSKLTNEKYLSYFKSTHGLDFVALRYTNVYGPKQNPFGDAGIVAIFTEQLLRGDTPIVYGDGFQTRDYVFIEDVVSANVAALREDVCGIFNVSTAREQSVLQVLNSIQLHLGLEVDPDFRAARKAEQRRSCCSFEVFEAATGWRPKVEFDAGIETTVNYFRQLVR